MVRSHQRSGTASPDAHRAGARASSWVVRWILDVLLGGRLELAIGTRRFRLTLERAFRLEEVDGGFVFFMGSAAALERRLTALAGGKLRRIRASAFPARCKNTIN